MTDILAAILTATFLHYTLPRWAAYGCQEARPVAAQVESLRVYGWPLGATAVALLATKGVAGRDGEPDSIGVDLEGPWTLYVAAVGRTGREACASNLVAVGEWPVGVGAESHGWTLGAPAPNPARTAVRITIDGGPPPIVSILDVTGRRRWAGRLSGVLEWTPPAPGLYWVIAEDGKRRSVRRFVAFGN